MLDLRLMKWLLRIFVLEKSVSNDRTSIFCCYILTYENCILCSFFNLSHSLKLKSMMNAVLRIQILYVF
jgi:hypothetical protein